MYGKGIGARGRRSAVKKKAVLPFAVCVKNDGYEAALERNKLYVVLPDRRAEADGLVRVIDEDGEDYLYPAAWFIAVELPKAVEVSLLKASRASTKLTGLAVAD